MAKFGVEKVKRISIVIEDDEAYKIGSEFWNLTNSLEKKTQAELKEKAPNLASFLLTLDEYRRT